MPEEGVAREELVFPEREAVYGSSHVCRLLKERMEQGKEPRILVADIDQTFIWWPDKEKSREKAELLRAVLKEMKIPLVFASGGILMTMSSNEVYERTLGQEKPEIQQNRFTPLVDPEVIVGGAGTEIWLLHPTESGPKYVKDAVFEKKLGYWDRWKVVDLVEEVQESNPDLQVRLSKIEGRTAYEEGRADVPPLPFRVTIECDSMETLNRAKGLLRENLLSLPFAAKLGTDTHAEAGKFNLYIVPPRSDKTRGVHEIISQATKVLGESPKGWVFGDSGYDLGMVLKSGLGAGFTGVLVGGASPEAKEDILGLSKRGKEGHTIQINKGIAQIKLPLVPELRQVVIGDDRYPGKFGPETILAVLTDKELNPEAAEVCELIERITQKRELAEKEKAW